MSGKYQNKSALMRFVHKYTGFIVCGVILSIAIPLYLMEVNSLEFFEKWTCDQVRTYYLLDGGGRFQRASELTPEQSAKFDTVLSECNLNRDTIGINLND